MIIRNFVILDENVVSSIKKFTGTAHTLNFFVSENMM